MKLRTLTAALLVGAMISFVAGCGGGDETAKIEPESSAPRNSDDASANTNNSDSETPDSELPDLSDIDMGSLGDCMSIGLAYAGLAMSAMGGQDAAKSAASAVEQMKANVPEELHDELDVLADAYGKVAAKGLMNGADALDTKEFKKADATITAYLDKTCGTSDSE